MEAIIMEKSKGKVCIPYGTIVSLNGITQRTFGNTDPPSNHLFTSCSKLEVRKLRDFDESNYPDGLCPSKLARVELSMDLANKRRKKSYKNILKNKAWRSVRMDLTIPKSSIAPTKVKYLHSTNIF